jgi:hypothetical protein
VELHTSINKDVPEARYIKKTYVLPLKLDTGFASEGQLFRRWIQRGH